MNRSASNTRTLVLPSGGTISIPLPGSSGRFELKPPTVFADATGSPRISLFVGLVLGVAIGVAATAWYLKH